MKLILTLFLFLQSCFLFAQNTHRDPVDVAQVDNIEIMKLNKENPHKFQSKMLSKNQFVDFTEKWNTARYLGAEKFKLVEYYVIVGFKDGSKRQFTISGSNAVGCKLQESESAAFEIKDKAFFDNLWLSIR